MYVHMCVNVCVSLYVCWAMPSSAPLIPSSVLRSTPWWCSGAECAAWGVVRCAHLASCLLLHQRHVPLSCCPQPESFPQAALSHKRHPRGTYSSVSCKFGGMGASPHFLCVSFSLPICSSKCVQTPPYSGLARQNTQFLVLWPPYVLPQTTTHVHLRRM